MIEIIKELPDEPKLKLVTSYHLFMPYIKGAFRSQIKVNGELYILKAHRSKEYKTTSEDIGEDIHIWEYHVVERISSQITYNQKKNQVFISVTRVGDSMSLTVEEWEAV